MQIEQTPLYYDAMRVVYDKSSNHYYGYRAVFHIGTETLEPIQVLAVNTSRDYVKNYADEKTATFMFTLGKYAKRIYPNRENLQVTLSKHPLVKDAHTLDADEVIESEEYDVILIDPPQAFAEGQGKEVIDEETLDLMNIIDVNVQLLSKDVAKVRTVSAGGNYRRHTVEEVLYANLAYAQELEGVDEQKLIKTIDVLPPSNPDVKNAISIRQGMRLVDVPKFLQKEYGVYSTGLGAYIQNHAWYVYSLYDSTRFNNTQKTASVLVLPQNKFTEIPNTYSVQGDALTIVATASTGFKDDAGQQRYTRGGGTRFTDLGKMDQAVTAKDGYVTVDRSKLNFEFTTDTVEGQPTSISMPSVPITSNPFEVYSDLAARTGALFKMIWENADVSLLYPAMPMRVSYFDDGEVKDLYGVLLGVQATSHMAGDIHSVNHSANAVLYIYVNKSGQEEL